MNDDFISQQSVHSTSDFQSLDLHTPVLLQEAIEALDLKTGMTVLDATLGGGGHAFAICEKIGSAGTLIGMDADEDAVLRVARLLREGKTRKMLRVENFRLLEDVLAALDIRRLNAALFDLGLSSFQLEASGRGFSFERDEPLFMTFDAYPEHGGAMDILRTWTESDLVQIFKESDEKFPGRIARAIVERRRKARIESAKDLGEIVKDAVPSMAKRGRIHPATKVFQALRMAVNGEMEALETGLKVALMHLEVGGRLVVISFHSGEDRIVKRFGKERENSGELEIVTKKPIIPTDMEIVRNTRSRSAKMRVFKKR
ncbi:MAG: 16S rRNA (cytosine(1402)-N(4))-methyltransferase [Candidatus Vogelbacteria bacterium CG10_big_fil_rev_8_21_14_0_10_45_14]|uniref:Ribosomal RNA small subunit methyltransferase H n=1 Tax=Candidatus Vogelbacteria bacterium CG10_big_fil_rev_8_21_14_0_10_45_14 TaxID=1975042 RepID=A0A2H0RJF7_9BACT|nr:MAG: 16S rRNA (cytosine(1402)-N(4))-methyltransferase [Candidatus Vogelbacteria bacterium CG10_big_fil_rev_8_21_14_0_10_45_14]